MLFAHRSFLISILICINFVHIVNALNFKISNFRLSWGNCGPSTDPVQLKSLSVNPDPIRIPGNITVSGSLDIATPSPTDVHAAVLLQRKVGPFFVKVPCVDNFGSCNYENACQLWSEFCPKYAARYGLPCNCPIPANTYSISNENIFVNKNIPPELFGEYRATIDVGSSESHLACVNIDLTIKRQ